MASHTDIIRKFDTIIQSMRAGGVNNPIDYIEQISYFLFLKLLDEREQQAEQIAKLTNKAYDGIFAGDNEKYRFRNWAHSLNGDELRLFIESDIFPFIRNLKSLRPEEREYFRNAHLKIYEPSTLKGVVENIASMDFSSLDTIDKGDLYEHMLSQISKSGKNGQFRTPRHIIDMMTSIVDPDIMETVYDPSVGTAGFIISAFQHILKKYSDPATMKHKTDDRGVDYTLGTGDKLTETQSSFLYQKTFYGYDIDAHMVRFSIMNMILHGFTEGTNIRIKDTLGKNTDEQDKARQYDIILANPPFSGTIDRSRIDSDDFPVASNSTEVLFLGHMIDKLRDGGRAAVIVPEGVLFKTNNDYQAIRKYLMNKCTLQAVISLPSGVFNPYSGVKTNILVFQKGGKTDKVWFYDMHTDGYDLGAQRRPNKETDIPDILHRWKQIKQGEQPENDRSWCATKEEIEKNEWVLSAARYKSIKKNISTKDIKRVKLSEVCMIERGGSPRPITDYITDEENGVNWIKIGDTDAKSKYIVSATEKIKPEGVKKSRMVYPGEFLLSNSMSFGRPYILKIQGCIHDGRLVLRPNETVNKEYLYYILTSNIVYQQFENLASGTGVKNLNIAKVKKVEIPLPSIEVQQELVYKLNAQQAIIDSIDTLIHQLEEAGIDESLFDSNDEWVELDEVCEKITDGSHFSPLTTNKGYPYITVRDIQNNLIDFENCKFVEEKDYNELVKSGCKPQKGDVLFSKDGTVGKVSLIDYDKEFVVLSSLAILRPNKDILLPEYLFTLLKRKSFLESAVSRKTGAAIKRIVLKDLKSIKVPLPSLEKQKNISKIFDDTLSVVSGLRRVKAEKEKGMQTLLSLICQ